MAVDVRRHERTPGHHEQAAAARVVEREPGKARAEPSALEARLDFSMEDRHVAALST